MRVTTGPLLRLVLSLGIFAAGVTPRLALCLGSDGHRAIEALDASCCQRGASSAGMTDGCARTCTDVPLSPVVGMRSSERAGPRLGLPTTAVLAPVSPPAVATRTVVRS